MSDIPSWLIWLGALNAAGILPAIVAAVRWCARVDARLERIEDMLEGRASSGRKAEVSLVRSIAP